METQVDVPKSCIHPTCGIDSEKCNSKDECTYIELVSIHHWSKNTRFRLNVVNGVLNSLVYFAIPEVDDDMVSKPVCITETKCDFTKFEEHWEVFFKFFGVPQCVGILGGEYTFFQVLDMLRSFAFPTVTIYHQNVCGCNMGHCGQVVSYDTSTIRTIGEMLDLVGTMDPHCPQYLYTYPDSVSLVVEPFTEAFTVKDKNCYSTEVELVQPFPNAYLVCYVR